MENIFSQFLNFAFSGFWAFTGALILLALIVNTIAGIIGRFFRMIMISLRGWPTNPNLDADGDFKKIEEKKE